MIPKQIKVLVAIDVVGYVVCLALSYLFSRTFLGYQFFTIMAIILTAVTSLDIWLLKGKSWARNVRLVLAIFNIFSIPIGTINGAVAIYILNLDQVLNFFNVRKAVK